MPFKRMTESPNANAVVAYDTDNFTLYEKSVKDDSNKKNLSLYCKNPEMNKLVTWELDKNKLSISSNKDYITNEHDALLVGTAFVELSEFIQWIKENN